MEEILRLRNELDKLERYERIKKSLKAYEYTASVKMNIKHNFTSKASAGISTDFEERHDIQFTGILSHLRKKSFIPFRGVRTSRQFDNLTSCQ